MRENKIALKDFYFSSTENGQYRFILTWYQERFYIQFEHQPSLPNLNIPNEGNNLQ